jgi:hypothetical protein
VQKHKRMIEQIAAGDRAATRSGHNFRVKQAIICLIAIYVHLLPERLKSTKIGDRTELTPSKR